MPKEKQTLSKQDDNPNAMNHEDSGMWSEEEFTEPFVDDDIESKEDGDRELYEGLPSEFDEYEEFEEDEEDEWDDEEWDEEEELDDESDIDDDKDDNIDSDWSDEEEDWSEEEW